jgi:putative sterol carrier protein
MHILAVPQYGIDDDLFILMDLSNGDCRSMRLVPGNVGENGDFVISGSMERWTQVGKRELDVVKGMMQGKLKLRGNLPQIVRYVKASSRLVEISAEVGGRFPDELSPAEVEGLRGWIVPLREKFGV